jgi:hypothetical protein
MDNTPYEQNLIRALVEKTAELRDIANLALENGYLINIEAIIDITDRHVISHRITLKKNDNIVYSEIS